MAVSGREGFRTKMVSVQPLPSYRQGASASPGLPQCGAGRKSSWWAGALPSTPTLTAAQRPRPRSTHAVRRRAASRWLFLSVPVPQPSWHGGRTAAGPFPLVGQLAQGTVSVAAYFNVGERAAGLVRRSSPQSGRNLCRPSSQFTALQGPLALRRYALSRAAVPSLLGVEPAPPDAFRQRLLQFGDGLGSSLGQALFLIQVQRVSLGKAN
jgi:hypothetical protein